MSKQEKVLVIHQPNFFPNIKLLQKICLADEWLIMDDVQYERREVQNRIKIRKLHHIDTVRWLSTSIEKPSYHAMINDVKFKDYHDLRKVIVSLVYDYYHHSIYYEFIEAYLERCFNEEYINLSTFCVHSIEILYEMLEIKLNIDYASSYHITSNSTQRLIDLCKVKNYKIYLSGLGGKNYIKQELFIKNGIRLLWHPWIPPKENLGNELDWNEISFLDYIARFGKENLKKYLEEGRVEK